MFKKKRQASPEGRMLSIHLGLRCRSISKIEKVSDPFFFWGMIYLSSILLFVFSSPRKRSLCLLINSNQIGHWLECHCHSSHHFFSGLLRNPQHSAAAHQWIVIFGLILLLKRVIVFPLLILQIKCINTRGIE